MAAKKKPASTAAGRAEARRRKESGVTKAGLPRKSGSKSGFGKRQDTKREKSARKASQERESRAPENENEDTELEDFDIKKLREEPLQASDQQRLGTTEDTSTGLSEYQPGDMTSREAARYAAETGAYWDPSVPESTKVDTYDDKSLRNYDNGSLMSPTVERTMPPEFEAGLEGTRSKQAARRKAAARETLATMPLTPDQAARQQRAVTTDTVSTVLGDVQMPGRVRTVDPAASGVEPRIDPKTGKLTGRIVDRSRPVQPKPVSRIDSRVRAEAKEAARALAVAEAVQAVDVARDPGTINRETGQPMGTVEDSVTRPIEGEYTDTGAAVGQGLEYNEEFAGYDEEGNPLKKVKYRRPRTRMETLAQSGKATGITTGRRSYFSRLGSRAVQAGGLIKLPPNLVGDTTISEQFRKNVSDLEEAVDPTRISAGETGDIDLSTGEIVYRNKPVVSKDEAGNEVVTPSREVTRRPLEAYGGERLTDIAATGTAGDLVARIAGMSSRRSELDPFAGSKEKSRGAGRSAQSELLITDEDIESAAELDKEGRTHTQRMEDWVNASNDPQEQARRRKILADPAERAKQFPGETSLRKSDERSMVRMVDPTTGKPATRAGGGDIEKAVPTNLRDEVQRNWRPYTEMIRRNARARRGRNAPEITTDEAIRLWSIKEGTRREWEGLMDTDTGKPSQSALATRVVVSDPATGRSLSGKALGGAVGNIPVNAQGQASVPDDLPQTSRRYGTITMARLRAMQPRLASALSRDPRDTGAITATTLTPDALAQLNADMPNRREATSSAAADTAEAEAARAEQLARAPEVQAAAAGRAAQSVTIGGKTYEGNVGEILGMPMPRRETVAPNTKEVSFPVAGGGTASRRIAYNPIPNFKVSGTNTLEDNPERLTPTQAEIAVQKLNAAGPVVGRQARDEREAQIKAIRARVTEPARGTVVTAKDTVFTLPRGLEGPVHPDVQAFARENVVAGRRPTSGAWFEESSLPATPENMRRAAARPMREAGITAARAVSSQMRQAEFDAAPALPANPKVVPDTHPERAAVLPDFTRGPSGKSPVQQATEDTMAEMKRREKAYSAGSGTTEASYPTLGGGLQGPVFPGRSPRVEGSRSPYAVLPGGLEGPVHPRAKARSSVFGGVQFSDMPYYGGSGDQTLPLDVDRNTVGLNARRRSE